MFDILSWNIRQGGGSRILTICDKLITKGTEVVILSEYRNNKSGQIIRQKLLTAGYRYQHVTASKPDENSVAIFSKLPCNFSLFADIDPTYSNNMICAHFEAFDVYGMYLPHKKKHILFDFLIEKAKSEKPAVMAGDFNTGINYKDQKGNSFWYTDKLAALSKENYIDAFRLKYENVEEFSWYSHQGNGYRYDHTYIHENLSVIVKDCYYMHPWRSEGFSDHSPMVLALGI